MGVFATVNDINVLSMDINSNFKNPCKIMQFRYPYLFPSVDIGSVVTGKINVSGSDKTVFYGNVKAIVRRRPENIYEYTCQDVLARAVEFFFAPANGVDDSYVKSNINHIDLIQDILSRATLTSFQNDWPVTNKYTGLPAGTFQFATGPEPLKIKVAAAWDVISWVCEIVGGSVYADNAGTVHLGLIWDEVAPSGETIKATLATGVNMKSLEYIRSDENLRNRVVVYGANGISYDVKESSPWVVDPTFYKTAIISYEFVDTNDMAKETGDINIHRLNRLTTSCIVEVLGNPDLDTRDIVTITDPHSDLSGDWFVEQCRHSISKSGYVTRLTGTR